VPAVQIPCPNCGSFRTYVVLSQQLEDKRIVRRRRCDACKNRWYTLQWPEVAISKYDIIWEGKKIGGVADAA
jgi:transcriptional regulator NrdR family protein